jgi:hypothetical protein
MRPINRQPNVVISAVIPYEQRQQLADLARSDDVTLSAEVREALAMLFAAREAEANEPSLVSA